MRKLLVLVSSPAAAIRLAPLVVCLRRIPEMRPIICSVSAHGKDVVHELKNFGIEPDEMLEAEDAEDESCLSLGVNWLINEYSPDFVLVNGDADALMASYRGRAAYGNLGAGLRAYELRHHSAAPGCESRVDLFATHYFVTTEMARDNLINKGITRDSVFVTDSTAVDALLMLSERIGGDGELNARLASAFPFLVPGKRLVLVVGHRRERDVVLLENACRAIKRLAMRPDIQIVYPQPPDPAMRPIVEDVFADHPGIHVIGPQDYLHHVYLMQRAHLILADSCEVLEEAQSLGKPLLLMRDAEERPNAVDAGTVKLVGTEAEQILNECNMFLDDESFYRAFACQRPSYEDGQASLNIAESLLR